MTTPRRLRVMQVIGSLHLGGAENVLVNLARGFDRSRFDVAVRCTRQLGVLADKLIADGIDVQLVAPERRAFRHFTPLALQRHISRWRPDVVHSHGVPAMLHTGPIAALGLVPNWVHTFHYGNYGVKETGEMRAERLLCRNAAQLIAVSDAQRAAILKYHGVKPDSIATIVNGVAPNPFVGDAENRNRKRAELGFSDRDIVVGTVAVLSEQKGITYFLQGAAQILAFDDRVHILIAGGGPLEEPLRREAQALGLGDRVRFTGWRSDSLEILPALDVFVMSSLWEAMPMVLLEAMSAARPIVVTEVGENRAIVADGRAGIVIPAKNAEAIAAAVNNLVGNPTKARELGAHAQRGFRDRFTTEKMISAYESLFSGLISGARGSSGRSLQAAHD